MERFKKNIILILVLLPIILALKNFWNISNPLVWGDAPYFFPQNLLELFNSPFGWDVRNTNFGGSQLLTLWLFIPTFLMGFFYHFFGLTHNVSIRLIFYLPFLVFGISGIFLILGRFKLSNEAKAFGVIFYILNTYILTLIDGGQIGIVLSYGLFPLCFYLFLNLIRKISVSNIFLSFFFHFLILNTDLRISLVLFLLEIIWGIFLIDKKNLKQVIVPVLVYFTIFLLSSFWVIPFLSGIKSQSGISGLQNPQEFIQLINSFYLFQPHFPDNDFGHLNKTPIYFVFLPLILFIGFLRKDKPKILNLVGILFLIFVFLAKGSNYPMGEIYNFFVNNIPLGGAFRDSSKFYIPAFFTGSILLGFSIDFIKDKITKFKNIWLILIYLFFLISIYPVFTDGLTGVLGNSPNKNDFIKIEHLVENGGNFRTLWFNERPPMGYEDNNHPPVSANLLFEERPFASMINGDYDLFGFLHNQNISNWYELLGIKYIFYPPYERKKNLTLKEQLERKQFEDFVSEVPGLRKVNLNISFPAYETNNPLPKIFSQKKALFVVGGDDIYNKLFGLNNFSLNKNPLMFLESCKFDPEIIFGINPKSFALISPSDKNDLYLSFFCGDFIPVTASENKEWAINMSDRYLNWKAQLAERGVNNFDYDFNKGLAYSTQKNEKLEFNLKAQADDKYYLPVRFLTASQSAGLKIDFADNEQILKSVNPDKMEWSLIGPVGLKKGDHKAILTNLGGLVAVNTLGLIPEQQFNQKKEQIETRLKEIDVFKTEEIDKINDFLNYEASPVEFKMINPIEYEVKLATSSSWLVFSERFDKDWKLNKSRTPLPFYSMINGYYVGDLKPGEALHLYYQPQDSVKKGVIISIASLLLVGFVVILLIISRKLVTSPCDIIKSNGYYKIRFGSSKN